MKKYQHWHLSGLMMVTLALGSHSALGDAFLPDFGAATFSDPLDIDNPYLPVVPGSVRTYIAEEEDEEGEIEYIRTETFVNPVSYPTAESVLEYWRKTTFYEPDAESGVRRDLETHFATSDVFVVEKHVMGLIATR